MLANNSDAPDILVFSSNFWDIGRWYQLQPEVLNLTEGGEDLFRPELIEWQSHFVNFLHYLQVHLKGAGQAVFFWWQSSALMTVACVQDTLPASTTKIYHTTAQPKTTICGGSAHEHNVLGHHEHVQQLNAVGRHQAKETGWHVVDFELMALQFHSPRLYLRDFHHPAPFFTRQAFQLYLNIHAADAP